MIYKFFWKLFLWVGLGWIKGIFANRHIRPNNPPISLNGEESDQISAVEKQYGYQKLSQLFAIIRLLVAPRRPKAWLLSCCVFFQQNDEMVEDLFSAEKELRMLKLLLRFHNISSVPIKMPLHKSFQHEVWAKMQEGLERWVWGITTTIWRSITNTIFAPFSPSMPPFISIVVLLIIAKLYLFIECKEWEASVNYSTACPKLFVDQKKCLHH